MSQELHSLSLHSKLPNPFGRPNEADTGIGDDSLEHDGRTRNFPHERGNWATYVYIQCKFKLYAIQKNNQFTINMSSFVQGPSIDLIIELQNELINVINSTNALESIKFHAIEDFHISLTRTVVLRHHWIDEFVRSIESTLKTAHK